MAGAPSPLLLLLLGVLCAPPARAGSHSFRYFYSALSGGPPGAPPFSAVGYVDDVEVAAYSSESRRVQPRALWMGRVAVADPQYWERNTEILRGAEAVRRADVRTLMGRHNQTAVPPQTLISRGKTGAATTLTCSAYGFYPREIEVKWMRNKVEVDWKTKTILPNTDGTYQIRSTVELPEGHNEKDYSCLVEHISLEDVITRVYEEKSGAPYTWIIVGVIVGVILMGLVTAVVIWKRKRADKSKTAVNQDKNLYTAVETNQIAGSDSSSGTNSV